jgi:nicotinamidase-related amidase
MKTALLLIDIQNDYFPGGKMELVGSVQAAAAAARLLSAFRKQSWTVVHVQHISTRPNATFFLPGTPGVEIYPGVTPKPGETIVTKYYPNSFRETDLLQQLKSVGVDTLLVCGMMTHMCVDATVRAAFDLGFSCIVAHDACATRDLEFNGVPVPAAQVHAAYMAAFGAVYARVQSADETLENIASSV